MAKQLPPRDPSEHLRFAIYEYTMDGNPWIVAEYDELDKHWSCRFCNIVDPDMFRLRKHINKEHLND